MKFHSLKNWKRINEIDTYKTLSKEEHNAWEELHDEGITVMFPGSFKPMHGAHLNLIKTYLSHPFVNKVIVFVGAGVRNGVDQEMAYSIAKDLTNHLSNVKIEKSPFPSPILTAYKAMEGAEPGNYAIAASSKGDDYKRVLEFTRQHEPGGKYHDNLPKGVKVFMIPVDTKPFIYIGRDDEFEKEPISASIVRKDVADGHFDNFATAFRNIPENKIKSIWDSLQGIITEAFVGTIPGGSNGYEDVDPEDRYKYRVQTLEEGGAASHMKNIWEANEFTFRDLRELIDLSFSGSLENVSEKLDGQNLMVTWKDGEVKAARNKGHLRNFGETSLNIKGMKEFFGGRGAIEVAFVEAMKDLEKSLKKIDLPLDKIFKNGKNWLNLEVLYPDTENIIPYDVTQLRIHHVREIDKNGELVRVHDDHLDELIGKISKVQNMEEDTFMIQKTNLITIKKIKDSVNIKDNLTRQLQMIQDDTNIDDNDTIQDYIDDSLKNFINEEWMKYNFEVDVELIESLVLRWGHGDKSIRINNLLKEKDPEIIKWVKEQDKNISKTIKRIIAPIESIFLKLGSTILNNLQGLAASNPTETAKRIKDKVEEAIRELKSEINKIDEGDPEKIEKITQFLGIQLERLEAAGGIDMIAPTEGIVFEYKGNLLKLTGNYSPVNQLIGFLKFGR